MDVIEVLDKKSDDATICSIGFCEKGQKWFGWSHRAIFGFGVGSEIVKGDCAYRPGTAADLYDDYVNPGPGWTKTDPKLITKGKDCVIIEHEMTTSTIEDPQTGEVSGWIKAKSDFQTVEIGRGEWTATTLDDARQMAIDFSNGVS